MKEGCSRLNWTGLDTVYWLAVVFVMLFFFVMCFMGINNVWVWGHDGYNGAAFAQAARNSIRFDTWGMARHHMGLSAPSSWEFYTHHPMSMHVHIVALFKLFGYSEWGARLPGAVYSWGTIVALFVFSKRYFDRRIALVTITVYALIPLNLIFANMVTHQHGSLFWCLVFLYNYSRWLETKHWGYLLVVLVGVSMAVQYDWPAYYIAFFTVLHAFSVGVKRQTQLLEWRPEYTFCALFSVVVLLNVYLYYSFIVELRGGTNDMVAAFNQRTSTTTGYIKLLWTRSLDMYGGLYLALIPIWLFIFAVRILRKRTHLGDQVPLYFFLAQCLHSLIFENAGFIHSYWTYNLNPGLAVMVAFVLVGLARWLMSVFADPRPQDQDYAGSVHWTAALKKWVIVIFVIVLPLTVQARFALKQFVWGFSTGDAAYQRIYNDQYLDIRFSQEIAKKFNRDNAFFYLHPSLHWRIEPLAYLDAPYRRVRGADSFRHHNNKQKYTIALFDLSHIRKLEPLSKVVRKHPTWVYERRFVAVNLSVDKPEFHAFLAERTKPGLLWKWLVNFQRSPIQWKPDPNAEVVRSLFDKPPMMTTTSSAGGTGGRPIRWYCPTGFALVGFDIWLTERASPTVYGLRPICEERHGRTSISGPIFGDVGGEPVARIRCKEGQLLSGVYGNAGSLLDSIGLVCRGHITEGDVLRSATGQPRLVQPVGGSGGTSFELLCPDGAFAKGITGAAGGLIDRVQLMCAHPTKNE